MNVSGIDATYYVVTDIPGCTEFYSGLFGFAPGHAWPGRLAEWTFDDGSSFGLYGMSDETVRGRNGSAMFAVGDVGQAVRDAQARGVTFHQGGEITDTDDCQMAFGEDPEGNQFILHHRK